MDRLERLKESLGSYLRKREMHGSAEHVDWLVNEVERLRKIEDAALGSAEIASDQEYMDHIAEVCRANPRPEKADG